jgi:hypothetical protein
MQVFDGERFNFSACYVTLLTLPKGRLLEMRKAFMPESLAEF